MFLQLKRSQSHQQPSSMTGNDQTFWQLAESALFHVLHQGSKSHRMNVVFDTISAFAGGEDDSLEADEV